MSNLINRLFNKCFKLNQQFLMFVLALTCMPVVLDFLSNFLDLPFVLHAFFSKLFVLTVP